MAQVLTGRRLRVGRGSRVLLEDFDIAVEAGEVLKVAGPNGSGKSSLLRVLAGVVMPRGGRLVRYGPCSYMPERVVLPAGMRSGRWLELMARMRRGVPAALDAELDVRCGVLSKGQLQRVALADALDSRASMLVLDEPWSGLDAAASGALSTRLTALATAGVAVLFTDHAATTTLSPTRTLVLGGAPGRPLVRVVLVAPDGRRHELVVPVADRDTLLAERLAQGWGVEAVRPA